MDLFLSLQSTINGLADRCGCIGPGGTSAPPAPPRAHETRSIGDLHRPSLHTQFPPATPYRIASHRISENGISASPPGGEVIEIDLAATKPRETHPGGTAPSASRLPIPHAASYKYAICPLHASHRAPHRTPPPRTQERKVGPPLPPSARRRTNLEAGRNPSMAGGKRRHARSNPTAGGPRHGAGAGRRRPVPELPSFVSPASVAAAFSSSSSGGRGRGGRGGRRGGGGGGSSNSASDSSSHAVPFSYAALRPSASFEGATQVLDVTIDTAPCADPASASVPVYSYGPVGGIGLGFHGEEEDEEEEAGEAGLHLGLGFRGCSNEEVELEEATLVTPRKPKEKPKGKRNEGFLSIGGIRIYTEDISSPESGVGDSYEESESDYEGRDGNDDGDSDEEGSDVNEGGSESDEELSGSDSEEDLSIGDSSVDDEVVADYMEGIGGSEELLSSKWVAGMNLVDSDDDDEMDTDEDEDGFLKKVKGQLEGYALMNASEQYGMKRPSSADRLKGKGTAVRACDRDLASMRVMGLDDVMMVKDVRMANRLRKGAKVASSSSHLSRSWPNEGRKSKKYQSVPGKMPSLFSVVFSFMLSIVKYGKIRTISGQAHLTMYLELKSRSAKTAKLPLIMECSY